MFKFPQGASCNGTSFLCNAGYELSTSGWGCQLCADGFSKSAIGNTACTQCAVGTETAASSQSCANCASGFYRSSLSLNRCIRCPTGATCSSTAISRCPNGFKINSNNDGCDQCAVGQDSSDGISCQACGVGYFKPSLSYLMCIKCPDGAASCAGSGVSCQTGYFYDSNVQCRRNDTYFGLSQTATVPISPVTSFVTLIQTSTAVSTKSVFVTETSPVQAQFQTTTVTVNNYMGGNGNTAFPSQTSTVFVTATVSTKLNECLQQSNQASNSVTLDFLGTLPISPLIFGAIAFGSGLFIMLIFSLICCRKARVKQRHDDFEAAGVTATLNTTSQRTFTNNSTFAR